VPASPAADPAPGGASARTTLQQRVAAAILEAAAREFAEEGIEASMATVAAAAGIARGTLYRYFPTRTALIAELADATIADAGSRLSDARLDELDARSALERAVRALLEGGDAFVVIARDGAVTTSDPFRRQVSDPLRRIFERAQRTGELRDDLSPRFLTRALLGLLIGVLGTPRPLGREDLVQATTQVFIDGARGKLRAASGE
jgi:TetR/AcrR family transcriptional regulator, mexCD-oprJ operon repressor